MGVILFSLRESCWGQFESSHVCIFGREVGFNFHVSAIGSGILRSMSAILYIVLALFVEWAGQLASA